MAEDAEGPLGSYARGHEISEAVDTTRRIRAKSHIKSTVAVASSPSHAVSVTH